MNVPWELVVSDDCLEVRRTYYFNHNSIEISMRKGIMGALKDLFIHQNGRFPESVEDKRTWIKKSVNEIVNAKHYTPKLKKKLWLFKVLINYNYKIIMTDWKKNTDYVENIQTTLSSKKCIYHYVNMWLQEKVTLKRMNSCTDMEMDDDCCKQKKTKMY